MNTIFIVFSSCSRNEKQVTRSYYYWKSDSDLDREEKNYLKQHNIHKLYVKLPDIDWSEVQGPYPAATDINRLNYHLNGWDSLRISIVPAGKKVKQLMFHITLNPQNGPGFFSGTSCIVKVSWFSPLISLSR